MSTLYKARVPHQEPKAPEVKPDDDSAILEEIQKHIGCKQTEYARERDAYVFKDDFGASLVFIRCRPPSAKQ